MAKGQVGNGSLGRSVGVCGFLEARYHQLPCHRDCLPIGAAGPFEPCQLVDIKASTVLLPA